MARNPNPPTDKLTQQDTNHPTHTDPHSKHTTKQLAA